MGIGHGKVILLGEHSVVYGRPALAAALDSGCHASAKVSTSTSLRIDMRLASIGFSGAGSFQCQNAIHLFLDRPSNTAEHKALRLALCALLETYPTPHPEVDIYVQSDLPAGAGLGCSAALGVAITRALDGLFGISRDAKQVAEASLAWERIFHGNPSGIDSAISSEGGIAIFYRGQPLQKLSIPANLLLVIGHCGQSSSTKQIVDNVAKIRARDPIGIERIFDEIGELVVEAYSCLETDNTKRMGELMNRNHALLARLGVSIPALDFMCQIARESGALGAKLTGSGGGGCMVALVADQLIAQRVVTNLRRYHYRALVVRIGVQ